MSFAGPARRRADDAREAARRLRPRRVEPPVRPRRRDRARGPSCARSWRGCSGSSARPHDRPSRARASRSARASSAACKLLARRRSSPPSCERLQRQLERLQDDTTDEEIWQSVELARHQERPYTLDYVERILRRLLRAPRRPRPHGRPRDRRRARQARRSHVALVGHQKGRDLKERTSAELRDGLPRGLPQGDARDGARRPPRLPARHARRHARARIPGVAAEQHGQGGAIARSQAAMVRLGVPTVAVVIGEGGSGGAVAIAVADRVLMQENAIYSVISPEGCAAILWRDASQAKKAAVGIQAGRRALPRARRDRRDRPRAGGWRPDRSRRAAALLREARRLAPRRARRDPAGRAAPHAPREVPRHGRLRLARAVSPHFPQAFPRLENRDLQGQSPPCVTNC